ncbi:MAG: DUF948 domain-containing protein [Nitrospirae bacterium]|nr:DUF948 domain-containing protein [Nitrospirota bacterium]
MENFFLGVIAGGLIILVAFLVPAISQIKRTAKAAEDFLQSTQDSLNPLLKRLQETVEKTNQVAAKLDESVSNVQQLTKAVGETGAIISDINSLVRKIQMFFSVTSSSFGAGIKTALSVLTHGAIQKITSQK